MEDAKSPSFIKKIKLVDADTGMDEGEQYVIVYNHFNGSYSFIITLEIQTEKNIRFIASWEVKALEEGNYTITILTVATQAYRTGEQHTLDQTYVTSKNVTILKGAPKIEGIRISPVHELDHIETLPPNQDIVVKCNVTSYPEVKNVTLYWIAHSIGSSPPQTWNKLAMIKSQENEWMAIILAQPEGQSVTLFIEAFSSINISSKILVGSYDVVDLANLEFKTKITASTIIVVLIAGCLGIFILKRKRIFKEL